MMAPISFGEISTYFMNRSEEGFRFSSRDNPKIPGVVATSFASLFSGTKSSSRKYENLGRSEDSTLYSSNEGWRTIALLKSLEVIDTSFKKKSILLLKPLFSAADIPTSDGCRSNIALTSSDESSSLRCRASRVGFSFPPTE